MAIITNDIQAVPASVHLPRFLRDMVLDAAAKSARSFSGEVVWRLSASFGVMPDGTARASDSQESSDGAVDDSPERRALVTRTPVILA